MFVHLLFVASVTTITISPRRSADVPANDFQSVMELSAADLLRSLLSESSAIAPSSSLSVVQHTQPLA